MRTRIAHVLPSLHTFTLTGVSDIRAGDVLFVMQLTGWRIAVTTANTKECPHASHITLDMIQNAMKVTWCRVRDQNSHLKQK